ncbi:CPBP family glutamic-type intramembrane protease [Streptomyces sp. SID1121]|uniref:CPBP family glutamic-type intramembrane protease n=1 Tax=Streptomyces sp. SID1121 TaxID=3425888 RepID=UPI004056019F
MVSTTARFAPSPKGAGWAYFDLALLLLLASWTSAAGSIVQFWRLVDPGWAPQAWYVLTWGQTAVTIAVFFWLSLLVIGRTPWTRELWLRRLAIRWAAVLLCAVATASARPVDGRLPFPTLATISFTAALVWLTIEVLRRHGITLATLGIRSPESRTTAARVQAFDLTNDTLFACCIGAGVTFGLVKLMAISGSGVPYMRTSQEEALGRLDTPLMVLVAVAGTVVLEDLVMVAAVTALLTAARRPLWEIYTITCAIEVIAHGYFGLPAIGMALYAAYRVWIYQQSGRLTPLMIGHAIFDLIGVSLWGFTIWQRVAAGFVWAAVMFAVQRFGVDPHRSLKPVDDAQSPPSLAGKASGDQH